LSVTALYWTKSAVRDLVSGKEPTT
jgi:hypothetical protein